MPLPDAPQRLAEAAAEFNRVSRRRDGADISESLSRGLNVLQDMLFSRVHEDVERIVGRDSVLMPVSEAKSRQATGQQIDMYLVAESAAAVAALGCLGEGPQWYWQWLSRLRLGEEGLSADALRRIEDYLARDPDDRRRQFGLVLAKVFPEARRAPLVLFSLMPLAVQLATALAFGDASAADELRNRQLQILPAIADCTQCRGAVLANGHWCSACENPLWKTEFLMATD